MAIGCFFIKAISGYLWLLIILLMGILLMVINGY